MSKVKIVSYALGGLAMGLLLLATILLLFVREYSTTAATSVKPVVLAGEVSVVPLAEVAVRVSAPYKSQNLSYTDMLTIVSPIVSVSTIIAPGPPLNGVAAPLYPTGEVEFRMTTNLPLQVAPNGFGLAAIAPDATFMVSSYDNGFSLFAQYTVQLNNQVKSYLLNSTSYGSTSILNAIYFNCNAVDTTLTLHPYASSVGCVGYKSITCSKDGVRVYVAYRQPMMNTDLSSPAWFPYQQLAGAVAVYAVPYQTSATDGSVKLTGSALSYNCGLSLQNPFGAQAAGLAPPTDPITLRTQPCDDYGSIIRTSFNAISGNRTVAVRANYGLIKSQGALIAVYEETSSTTHSLTGLLQLQDAYGSFKSTSKLSFANDFNMGNDTILAAVRDPSNATRYVLCFQQNGATANWEFKQTLTAPLVTEDFGVSILVSNDGNMAIVGAPTLPLARGSQGTPGVGGSLYVYSRADDGSGWSLRQTVTDPFPTLHTFGAFGYFLTVDPLFLVIVVSSNQNNVLDKTPTAIGTAAQVPTVCMFPLNQVERTIDTSAASYTAYPGLLTDLMDPLFGCNVPMCFVDKNPKGNLTLFLNSPLNRTMYYYLIP